MSLSIISLIVLVVVVAIGFIIKLDMNFDYLFRSSYMPV